MCTFSMVVNDWTNPQSPNHLPWLSKQADFPSLPIYPPNVTELSKQMLEILQRLDKLDKALGLKDCSAEEEHKKRIVEKLEELSKLVQEGPKTE